MTKVKENDVVVFKKDYWDWRFDKVFQNATEGGIGIVKAVSGETVWIQVHYEGFYVRFQCYINKIEKIGVL